MTDSDPNHAHARLWAEINARIGEIMNDAIRQAAAEQKGGE